MTKMAPTQGGTTTGATRTTGPVGTSHDPVDLLVPPARSRGRSLVLIGLLIVVGVAVVVVGNAGVLRPRLGLVSGVSSTEAGGARPPELTFVVRNLGSVPLYLDGVDAQSPGLGRPTVRLAVESASGAPGRRVGGPVRVGGGGEVVVSMTFGSWNCGRIDADGSDSVPVHMHGPLGIHTTVSVLPGVHFDRPDSAVIIGSPDPDEIGWAAGITWRACHGGARPEESISEP
jgi:hypothetical protein